MRIVFTFLITLFAFSEILGQEFSEGTITIENIKYPKSYFILPMPSPNLSFGLRIKAGEKTAFHFEVTPSWYYGLIFDKTDGVQAFYFETQQPDFAGFTGAGLTF